MGFFGFIGSALISAASWVGNALSSAVSWVGNALSRGLEACINIGGSILSGITRFAGDLARALGLFKPYDPDAEQFGERALQAHEAGIVPENFPDFESYVEHLRHFEIDPEKSKELSFEQKAAKGLEIAGRLMEEKFGLREGSMAEIFALHAANPEYFNVTRLRQLLDGGLDIDAIAAYFEKRIGGAEALEIEDALVDLEHATQPEKNPDEVRQELWRTVDTTAQNLENLIRKGATQ